MNPFINLMGKIFIFNLIGILTISSCYYIPAEENINKTYSNFSFGSCFLGFLSDREDMFKTINKNKPELWVWLGDATYIDFYTMNYFSANIPIDMQYAESMFNKVKNEKCKKKNYFLLTFHL